ncbi:hypothetical protein BME23_12620 [Klebsiella pneumoniae]|nr:hypothetical protein BME23_12620 [Klebsiella pneumoniae]HBX1841268.1 hypothetical protein [Klebsiella pneumoniae]HBX1908251.1 hypothetical protein [Klebsiella pneumoniae]
MRDLNQDLEIGYEEVRGPRGSCHYHLIWLSSHCSVKRYGYDEILKHGFWIEDVGRRNIAKLYG